MDIIIKRKPVSIPVLPILAGVAVIVLLLVAMRVGRVQPSQIGVLVNNLSGNVDIRTSPGAVVYNGLLTDFYILDNSVQTIRMVQETGDEVRIKTDDGADVTMDVEVNYRLMQNSKIIAEKVIPESGLTEITALVGSRRSRRAMERVDAYKGKWVRDYARSVVRYVFGELDTKSFYNASERDRKTRKAEAELNRLLGPHGIQVNQVVPDKFRFMETFESIIADTQAAVEEVESQRRQGEAALEDQKKQQMEADAKASIEIASVLGELKKAVLVAQAAAARETMGAEAYKYSMTQQADAAFYQAKNEALGLLAKAAAEAEGMRRLAAALSGDGGSNLVKLEYARVLQGAQIRGLPYATDPRIQKVEVTNESAAAAKTRGGK